MKSLPNKWYIRIGKENDNHPAIKYLNKKYNRTHDGSAEYYGDFDGYSSFSNEYNTFKGMEEITLEWFNKTIQQYYFY